MNEISEFTSTGSKLLYHVEVIRKIRDEGKATPISISVALTSRCNLKCSFCSNVNRDKHQDLDPDRLCGFLSQLKARGLKTVEWTGGGEPTLYKHINEMILFTKGLGLEQGMITNGILLKKKLSSGALDSLKWIRVSMNCLDYIREIDLPEIKGTLGFSYVMNEETNSTSIFDLKFWVDEYKPKYVRIVPNCLSTKEEQISNNEKYSTMVEKWGSPYFYQAKVFESPERCWWGYLKLFLLHDSYLYPCSSVVLNEDAGRKFHEKYRWIHMDDMIETLYDQEMSHFDTKDCDSCVFCSQNNLVDSLIYPSDMRNFI